MKIELGKTYVTRDGRKMGPLIPNGPSQLGPYPLCIEVGSEFAWTNSGAYWSADGSRAGEAHSLDLVAEYDERHPAGDPLPIEPSRGTIDRDAYGIAAMDALAELRRAREMFGPMASMHEGWAVIYEEFIVELGEIVWSKQKNRNLDDARKEAIQVAAMALAFAAEVCTEERGRR